MSLGQPDASNLQYYKVPTVRRRRLLRYGTVSFNWTVRYSTKQQFVLYCTSSQLQFHNKLASGRTLGPRSDPSSLLPVPACCSSSSQPASMLDLTIQYSCARSLLRPSTGLLRATSVLNLTRHERNTKAWRSLYCTALCYTAHWRLLSTGALWRVHGMTCNAAIFFSCVRDFQATRHLMDDSLDTNDMH